MRGSKPKDMETGVIHTTNGSGDIEIVEYIKSSKVLVKFCDGSLLYTSAGQIRLGEVQNPCKFKNRNRYKFKTNSGWSGEVLEYINASKVLVKFQCGEIREVSWNNILSGGIKPRNQPTVFGKGYFGVGEYVPKSWRSHKGKKYPEEVYNTWVNMIRRIHSNHVIKAESRYTKVSIEEDWYNFQNFCSWSVEQIGYNNKDDNGRAWCLDKDILLEGNLVYRPDTCVYVPDELNIFFAVKDRGKGMQGTGFIPKVTPNSREGYGAYCQNPFTKKNDYLGFFYNEVDANRAYCSKKNEFARELAEKYEGLVDSRVIEALKNFDIKRRSEAVWNSLKD